MKRTFLLLAALFSVLLEAEVRYFESGMLEDLNEPSFGRDIGEVDALTRFFDDYYRVLPDGFQWKQVRRLVDNTHVHLRYQLHYNDLPVLHTYLNIHYNRDGWIQYADSNWSKQFTLPPAQGMRETQASLIESIKSKLKARFRSSEPRVWAAASIYLKDGKPLYVFKVETRVPVPLLAEHYLVAADSLETVARYKTKRHDKVYNIHPDRSMLTDETLPGMSGGETTLEGTGGFVHVRREQDTASPEKVDVAPGTDYSIIAGWSALTTNPQSNYDHSCDTNASVAPPANCPNQEFSSVGVYYHIAKFRETLEGYLTTLGATIDFSNDPLNVTVNTLSLDLDGDADGSDETNNAFYLPPVSSLAVADDLSLVGLYFLRPAAVISSTCGGAVAEFFDLSRESLIVVHEYQHYVTDKITGIEFVAASQPSVGDHIHEGYSDYFGASQVSALAGETVTIVGEYAFQQCTAIQRDISQLKVFTDESSETPADDFSDPHVGGWTWASGLWKLRTDLGVETADLIALKSLFFLSSNPGFIEAVESLVKADQALNAGANVETIRALFYETLTFGPGGVVVRPETAVQNTVGFESCLAIGPRAMSGQATLWVFVIWLVATLGVGRLQRK